MRLRVSFYMLLFFITQQSFSQEGVALYTDYINDNYYLIHPSMAGASNCAKFRLTARQQWFGQRNAPGLQTLTVNDRLGDNSGIGAIFFNDKNGYTSQTGGKISYSKHLRMGSSYLELNHVHLGISAGLAQTRLNETDFDLTVLDPTIGGTRQKDNYFNIDVGASYLKNSFFAHLTLRNAAQSRREIYTEVESTDISNLIFNIGYSFMDADIVMVEPSIMYGSTLETKEAFLHLNVKAYRNVGDGQVFLGFSFKRQYERAEGLATDRAPRFLSLTPILGGKYNGVLFAYNYTQPLSNVGFTQGGYHQFTIGLDIWCNPQSYDCNCPAVNNVN